MKKRTRNQKDKNIHKVIISELKYNPFRKIKSCFALMVIIPLLVLFYLIIGKNFLYELFLGTDGLIIGIALIISCLGFFVAYRLVVNIVNKLFSYFIERKLAEEEKIEVLSGLTHDLKTPLSTIRASLQNIADGICGYINKTQQYMANTCIKSLDKATNFINQMLNLAKQKITITQFQRELINFGQLVKDEVDEITVLAKKNNQKVHCRILSTKLKMWGNKEKLSRAIMNLLSNAVKYSDKAGRLDIILSSDSDTIKLAVINTGAGIPQDKLNKIFTKYERIKSSSQIEGSGLGLFLVKDVIDLHEGHITVRSIPSKETEFNITLPRDLRAKTRTG